MYKSIVIIGIGSLGGFFAESISRMNGLQSLILIDPDIVEEKNVNKSIYRRKDVGKRKVEALKEIIEFNNEDLVIKAFPITFKEGKTLIPNADLVVDCRDVICSRCGDIDVRMYISYRTLIIDCKRFVTIDNEQEGRYIQHLNNGELITSANSAFTIIYSGKIKEMIKKQMTYQISIDCHQVAATEYIKLYDNRPDIVSDDDSSDRIKNLHEQLPQIVTANKARDLMVIVGQESCVGQQVNLICKSEIKTLNDANKALSRIVDSLALPNEHYTVSLAESDNDTIFVELLPDTGAA